MKRLLWVFMLIVTGLTFTMSFAGDPVGTVTYVKQGDGTVQKIEVLAGGQETQARIDALDAIILNLQAQKAQMDTRYDTEIANAQRERIALTAAK